MDEMEQDEAEKISAGKTQTSETKCANVGMMGHLL